MLTALLHKACRDRLRFSFEGDRRLDKAKTDWFSTIPTIGICDSTLSYYRRQTSILRILTDSPDLPFQVVCQTPDIVPMLLIQPGAVGRLKHPAQPGTMKDLGLRHFGGVQIPGFGNRRFLFVRGGPIDHSAVGIALFQPRHCDLEGGFRFFVFAHLHSLDKKKGRVPGFGLQAPDVWPEAWSPESEGDPI